LNISGVVSFNNPVALSYSHEEPVRPVVDNIPFPHVSSGNWTDSVEFFAGRRKRIEHVSTSESEQSFEAVIVTGAPSIAIIKPMS